MEQEKLTTDMLRQAYSQGYFPMPDPESGDVLWYNPDPRAVIPLDKLIVSRSLMRSVRNRGYSVTFNKAFSDVVSACADRKETWISGYFKAIYTQLHDEGDAHSVEVWREQELVGGLYGVSIGGAFFAESMFHKQRDASKVALYQLVERMKKKGMVLLEVQFLTAHLVSLGAVAISAESYLQKLLVAIRDHRHVAF